MHTKKSLLLLIILTAVFAGCINRHQKQESPAENQAVLEQTAGPDGQETRVKLTATESGQTALELLEANATVSTIDYGDAGQFVNGINGVFGDDENFWSFYYNGEFALVGPSQTELSEGDTIEFVYEKIDETQQ